MAVRRFNLLTGPVAFDEDEPAGYRMGLVRVGQEIGGTLLGGSVYELPPGQSICPYHYEYGNEEWLIVLSGRPALRHPGGEEQLEAGDAVCFPVGPDGAHKVTNRTDETLRVLLLSTKNEPSVVVYPDSDKIGVFDVGDDRVMVRREDASVPYYDREI